MRISETIYAKGVPVGRCINDTDAGSFIFQPRDIGDGRFLVVRVKTYDDRESLLAEVEAAAAHP